MAEERVKAEFKGLICVTKALPRCKLTSVVEDMERLGVPFGIVESKSNKKGAKYTLWRVPRCEADNDLARKKGLPKRWKRPVG